MSESQRKLASHYPELTSHDLSKLESIAGNLNTLRRIEKAVTEGVHTQGYMPDFVHDVGYIASIQKLVIESVFGYWNEHQKPAGLRDIYNRVLEKIRLRRLDQSWPWQIPSKRTVDRRVNECASANAKENHCLAEEGPRVIQDHIDSQDSYYRPNPAMFEQAVKEAAT